MPFLGVSDLLQLAKMLFRREEICGTMPLVIFSRILACIVSLLCVQLLGMAVWVVSTTGRQGVVTALVLGTIGVAIGSPAISLALRSSSSNGHRS